MSSGDFSNLVIRRATAYNPDGSFIKDGYIFTVGSNGKQSWTPDLKLNNLVLSTVTLNSQLYVSSSIFDRTTVSTLAVSTLSASSVTISTTVMTNITTCTLNASTLIFPAATFSTISARNMNSDFLVTNDATASTLRTSNLSATNFSFYTLAGSTLTGNFITIQSTITGSTVSTANMGFTNGIGSTLITNSLTTNTLTVLSTIIGSSLTISTLTTGSIVSGIIQGSTLTINTANVQSTLTASTVLMTSAAYSTLTGSTFSANAIVFQSTLLGSTVNVMNIGYSTLVGSTLAVNTVIVRSTVIGSTVNAVNVGYSTLQGSTLTMNTGVWNSTLIGSTLNMINATYSTLAGSTLNANTVIWNSTLIGSTLNAIYVTYSTIQGSTLIANNITVQSTLTASTVNAVNIGCSTFSANTVVIQSTLVVSSVSGSTLLLSTMSAANITTGSIGFSTLTGSSMVTNMLTIGSTVTASSLNAVNMSYSTLQGGAIQSQSMIASTLSGSTINFDNLTFSTLLASTMTANVMFPLSLVGSTMNVTNLLTATNVGIGTTSANYPLTVSNTAFGVMELNRISTTTTFYGAGTVYTVTDPANNRFKGKYAYAFGGAKTLAIASQSQANGYYAIDVANSGLFGSDTAGDATGAMFYMDSTKTYFQNTALGVGTTSPSWPLTVAKDLSFTAMTSNPLDATLVITGKTNTGTLKIGTYYTGVSFGAAIQSSQFVTGNDTVATLILNPLGGNVGIGSNSASSRLHVVGSGSATTLTINNNNASYSNTFSLMMTNNQAIPSQFGFVQKAVTNGSYHTLTQTGDHLLISKDVSAGVTGANGIVIASQDQTAGLRIGTASSAFNGDLSITGNLTVSSRMTANAYNATDDRSINPSEIPTNSLKPFFGSWDNNSGGFYADAIGFNSYTDASGGNSNLLMIYKNGFGIRQYQAAFGSATRFSSYMDCCMKIVGAESYTIFTGTQYSTNPSLYVGCKTGMTPMYSLNQAGIIVTDGNLHLDASRRSSGSSAMYYGFYANQDGNTNNHQFYGNVSMNSALNVSGTITAAAFSGTLTGNLSATSITIGSIVISDAGDGTLLISGKGMTLKDKDSDNKFKFELSTDAGRATEGGQRLTIKNKAGWRTLDICQGEVVDWRYGVNTPVTIFSRSSDFSYLNVRDNGFYGTTSACNNDTRGRIGCNFLNALS